MSKKKLRNATEQSLAAVSPGLQEQTVPETANGKTLSSRNLSEMEEYEAVMKAVTSETRYGVIYNARYVNVRDAASPTANVIRVANEGERVILVYEDNGFYKVEFQDKSEGFISSDFIKEIHGSDTPDDWFTKSESILTSVKKLLGIDEECEEFDLDIMMNINSAIFTLRQLGVGPEDGFQVTSKNVTYSDYLGDNAKLIPEVKMYLFYKTKLGWDTPQSSAVIEIIKEQIREAEWRLNVQVDPEETFEKDGEIQNDT